MTDETSAIPSGVWRWGVGAVVVLLMIYPLARWTTGRGGAPADTKSTPAQTALQTSFEHYQAGKYPEAIAAAKLAIQADPKLADAYNNLAVAYLQLRQYDEGIKAAQQAIELQPTNQLAKNNLAWIQREKAKAAGSPIPAEPSSVAGNLLNQSLSDYQAGRFKDCMDHAVQSAKMNPASAQAFNNIGICAGHLNLWDEAIKNTQEAIRLAPDMQLARNNLAWIMREKQKIDGPGAK